MKYLNGVLKRITVFRLEVEHFERHWRRGLRK